MAASNHIPIPTTDGIALVQISAMPDTAEALIDAVASQPGWEPMSTITQIAPAPWEDETAPQTLVIYLQPRRSSRPPSSANVIPLHTNVPQ